MPLPMAGGKGESSLSSVGKIVAVAAGKGGVGKSTVTANLALSLKRLGRRVGILDSDIYGPSIRKILPEEKMVGQRGDLLTPAISHGISLMSMAYFRREDESTSVRAPIANGMIQQFLERVVWGELDYLLIDYPPGTGDIQITVAQRAPLFGAVMVTTPQELALMDVRRAMHLFEQVQVPIIGIVENMSYFAAKGEEAVVYPFGRGGGRRLAAESGLPLLGEIPLDPSISLAADRGVSIYDGRADAGSAASAFTALAESFEKELLLVEKERRCGAAPFVVEWKEMEVSRDG